MENENKGRGSLTGLGGEWRMKTREGGVENENKGRGSGE